jgi:hypothetical protein
MRGDGWAGYLEGRERMDVIKTARPQWMNLNVSDTARLDKFFDHTATYRLSALPFFEFSSIVKPKLLTPLPNGLIGHRDATFGQ